MNKSKRNKSFPPASQYPKRLFISNNVYRVIFSKKMQDFGETDPVKCTITIKAGMSRRETFKTFIHEVLHMIEFENDLNISHKLVYSLEEAIYQVLIDNFIQWE